MYCFSELTDKKAFSYARTKGELTLQDLPPIEDLSITVEESKCKPIGSVFNMVDAMGEIFIFFFITLLSRY